MITWRRSPPTPPPRQRTPLPQPRRRAGRSSAGSRPEPPWPPSKSTRPERPPWRPASSRTRSGIASSTSRSCAAGPRETPDPPPRVHGCSTRSPTSTPTPLTITRSPMYSHGSSPTSRTPRRWPLCCRWSWSRPILSRFTPTTGGKSSSTARPSTPRCGTMSCKTAWATCPCAPWTCSTSSGSPGFPTSRSRPTCSAANWSATRIWRPDTRS